jgi:hypothetical protein
MTYSSPPLDEPVATAPSRSMYSSAIKGMFLIYPPSASSGARWTAIKSRRKGNVDTRCHLIIGNSGGQPRKEREKTFEIGVGKKLTLDRVDANSICRRVGNTPAAQQAGGPCLFVLGEIAIPTIFGRNCQGAAIPCRSHDGSELPAQTREG